MSQPNLSVSIDKSDEHESRRLVDSQQIEIAHLSRVTMLGEISGSIAHELNQPLTAIMTNAETAQRHLSQTPANLSELRHILSDIIDDVSRAAEVIRLLRGMQKKSATELHEVDLHSSIADVTRIIGTEADIRNVAIQLQFSDDMPTVRADKVQLEQVVINLLLNAFDAMSEVSASPRVVTVSTTCEGDAFVQVAVTDTGSGLGDESLRKMFEPFYTSKANGLGLGLSICKNIIESHGGKLTARNSESGGAELRFTLLRFVPVQTD